MGDFTHKLTSKPARKLTDREVAKIVGGTVGVMLELSDPDTVRKALEWILQHWDAYVQTIAGLFGDGGKPS